ncbi:MAG: hypothetical protein ACFBSG_16100, partial [Leptolyngbyaceae cyanobacterium]
MMSTVKPLSQQIRAMPIALYQQNATAIHCYGRWFAVSWLGAMADSKIFLAMDTSTLTYLFLAGGVQFPRDRFEPLYLRV